MKLLTSMAVLSLPLVTFESDERKLSRSQKTFRAGWLGAESDGD